MQYTQEIKGTLFNWTKQDKTCKFLRKSSFASYVQQKNRQLIQLMLCQLDVGGWQKDKGTCKKNVKKRLQIYQNHTSKTDILKKSP